MANSGERTAKLGIVVGAALVVLGVGAYVVTDFASVTALLPAAFGIVFVALGRVGLETGRGRAAVSAIGLLALVGLGGTVRGLADGLTMLAGGAVESPIAVASRAIMAALCVVLVVSTIAYVIDERRSVA